jgi:hypothetical protein
MVTIFPEIIHASKKQDIEALASLVRRYFGEREASGRRTDVTRLAQTAGLEIRRMPMTDLGALVAREERGAIGFVAVLARGMSAALERTILAHQLGHVFLTLLPQSLETNSRSARGFKETRVPGEDSSREASEALADRFAAALLMPCDAFRAALSENADALSLAREFDVEVSLVKTRAAMLSLTARDATLVARDESTLASGIATQAALSCDAKKLSGKELEATLKKPSVNSAIGAMAREYRRAPETARAGGNAKVPTETTRKDSRPGASDSSKPLAGKGLERLREIARKMDKDVP